MPDGIEDAISHYRHRLDEPLWLASALAHETSRRTLIRRHFAQRLSIRPQWTPCVQIECPADGEVRDQLDRAYEPLRTRIIRQRGGGVLRRGQAMSGARLSWVQRRQRRGAAAILMKALMDETPDVKSNDSVIIEAWLWRQAGEPELAASVEQWIVR